MINLEKIDSRYPIEKILPFCEESIGDARPGASNMNPIDWENNKASFLYLLYIEKRYNGKGNGYIIYKKNDRILCGSGFSVSDIDENITHLSSRSYTVPGIRLPRVQGAIHDLAIDISMQEGRFGAFSSLNEYNAKLIPGYLHINDPRNHPGYFVEDGKHYAKPGVRIHPMDSAGPLRIRDTKQWIAYMIWNESYRDTFLQIINSIKWNT